MLLATLKRTKSEKLQQMDLLVRFREKKEKKENTEDKTNTEKNQQYCDKAAAAFRLLVVCF